MSIKAILFDLDGVLWSSKTLHYMALNTALAECGCKITPEEQMTTFEGLPTKVKLNILTKTKGLPESHHASINKRKQEITAQMMADSVQPNERLITAFRTLKSQGFKLALCSNSIRKTVDIFLDKSGLFPYFDISLSNEDVAKAKPEPDMYLKAMEQLGVKPEECLIFEDSETGIKAARASGAHVQVVNNPSDIDLESVHGALAKYILPNPK